MSTNSSFTKDPDAFLDYAIDWTSWLDAGDTIAGSTWTVPTGITGSAMTFTTTKTTIWLAGGTDGSSYSVINHITTAQGRTEDKTLTFVITQH